MEIVSTIKAKIIKEIGVGKGQNSRVFLAYDPQLGGEVALKEMHISRFKSPDQYFNEAKALYANRSPRVVPVNYACRDADHIRIVMPYYRNGSLQDKLYHGPLTVRKIIEWADQFLTGAHYVHANHYIHFDIKPSNILIQNDGSVALADFGQSMPVNYLGVADVPAIYWVHYPPEAFLKDKVTLSADMYQIGLTLYRMCNGDQYFKKQLPDLPVMPDEFRDALQRLVLSGKFPNRNSFLPHIPLRLRTIVRKLLKIDPSDRYETIIDLQNDLGQVDTSLDWEYNELTNGAIWRKKNITHEYEIKLEPISNKWIIVGHTIRRSDGLRRRKGDWCDGPFPTRREAEKRLERLFRSMEE